MKNLLYIIVALLIASTSFAGVEDTYGNAEWSEAGSNTFHVCFGVGNATNSYSDWIRIPDNIRACSVQILNSTSSSSVTGYPGTYDAPGARAKIAGSITNASFALEVSPYYPAAATPVTTVLPVDVFDLISPATAAESGNFRWTLKTAIPPLTKYGIYRMPLYGEHFFRVVFGRTGATAASTYHWALVRFKEEWD